MASSSSKLNQPECARRIRYIIERLNLSQSEFARKVGIDPANLSKHINGKIPITNGLLNRISVDVGVNKRWLATGIGLPFDKNDPEGRPSGTPIYDVDVTAGATELTREFTNDRIIGSVTLPSVSRDAVIVRVYGDSMQPDVPDGSYIAIRPVTDNATIQWGQIYVVVLDDFRVMKFLRRHPDPDKVILRSANDLYDDMEVDADKIRKLYIVEAILNFKIRC